MMMEGRPGDPPLRMCLPIADLGAAMFAVQAVLAALFERQRSGLGDDIEIPMYDSMLSLLTYTSTLYLNAGKGPQRMGSDHEYTVPWQATSGSDAPFVVAVRSDKFWARLCAAIDRPEWVDSERFATNAGRLCHRDELRAELDATFATRTAREWLAILADAGVPASPIRTVDEALTAAPDEVPHMLGKIAHETLGTVQFVRNPISYARLDLAEPAPAPALGEYRPADSPDW
jgi:CoA:oxalate CoA-transferase